jgi:uncharacterized DUF497 family protein
MVLQCGSPTIQPSGPRPWPSGLSIFADAAVVFAGPKIEFEDTRRHYGEQRMLCFGLLRGPLVLVGYVVRGDTRHVFTMRKCNDREKATYRERLGEG